MKPVFAAAALSLAATLTATPSAWAADTYEIEPTHTFARFSINHLGLSTTQGRFDTTRGTITLDPAKKTGSVEATIDVASISTGVAKLDEHLKAPDFFDAAKYPTIVFKSTDFRFKGEAVDEVVGTLTMHGVSKPVTLKASHFVCTAHPMRKIPVCAGDFSATIQRSDWGISTYSPHVGESVTLSIQVEALKK
ncbi:MAG TPA: YceI family protein [Solimonas sp.]|nr:YceI family protein [Solimonas sp.]